MSAYKGLRFQDKTGRWLILVDKFQQRQKHGYWVSVGASSQYLDGLLGGISYSWAEGWGWPFDIKSGIPWSPGNLCICAVDELDEETNEFGVVTP